MIFLDACAVIYLLEGDPATRESVWEVLKGLAGGEHCLPLAVSALSRLECRVRPLREGDGVTLQRYDAFFAQPGLVEVPLDIDTLNRATELRATEKLRTPDALQAASAFRLGTPVFVTADQGFRRVEGLDVRLLQPPGNG